MSSASSADLLERDASTARLTKPARPAVLEGVIGLDPRAMGGALLPLCANFAPDRDLFLKLAE